MQLITVLVSIAAFTAGQAEDTAEIDPMMLELYDQQMQETFGELNLGKQYFEGDIILSKEQSDFLQDVWRSDHSQTRDFVNDVLKLWPNNTIPYTITRGLREISRLNILLAIKEWQEEVCVTFKERQASDEDYIEFSYEGGCSSSIGRIGGRQVISVGSAGTQYTDISCRSPTPYGSNVTITCTRGNILHEIGHALGFLHEHSRPDRDRYLKVLWENVMPGCRVHFRKEELLPTSNSFNIHYDYKSVMHYGPFFFARERGLRTLQSKRKGGKIGQREKLSKLDVEFGRLMYRCDEGSKNGE